MNRLSGSRLLVAAAVLGATLLASPALAGTRVYVKVAPPTAIVEVRTVAPSPNHVWIGGFHRWNGTAYVWVPGHWVVAPRPGAVWVPGHWARHRVHGHYWIDGRWR